MSKRRSKNKQKPKNEEILSQADSTAADADAGNASSSMGDMSVVESPTGGFLIDDSSDESALADLDFGDQPASATEPPTPPEEETPQFADAGTEYIEGFLRDELGLDGDLTDDEFALAALDFLGDAPVEGGTVYFNPQELEDLAAQEKLAAAKSESSGDDPFAQSVAELEEAIAAVSDPEFKDEGTVMMSLKSAAPDDVLADANKVLDAVQNADAVTDVESVSEIDKPDEAEEQDIDQDVEPDAVAAPVAVVDDAVAEEQPVMPLVDADVEVAGFATDSVEPSVEMEDVTALEESDGPPPEAVAESEVELEAVAEPESELAPSISAQEQAELDEAMAELREIQAMLQDDGDEAEEELALIEPEPEPVVAESVEEDVVDADVADTAESELEAVEAEADEIDAEAESEVIEEAVPALPEMQEAVASSDDSVPEHEETESAELDSMVIDVDEPAAVESELVPEPMLEGLRFDLDAIQESMQAESDDDVVDLHELIDGDESKQLMEEMGLSRSDLMPELMAFDEGNDYLDSIVAALDSKVTEVSSAETTYDLNSNRNENFEQVIVFRIGQSHYGIPIDNVLEIGEPLNETTVPFVPSWVRGVINLRGEVISLVDLRTYFETNPDLSRPAEWMIVTQTRDASMMVGFIVDGVIGNRQLNTDNVAKLSSVIEGPSSEFLDRIFRHDDELVAVLDFDKLLRSSDMRQFEPV